MAADGELIFEITADDSGAMRSIDDVSSKLKKAGKEWENSAKQSTGSIGSSFTSMFAKIASVGALVKAGKALVDFASEAVGVASALTEVQNVVDVTFGAGASKIEKWAQAAGQQFGLTELQAKQYTSSLGAMMKSAGMAEESIVDISTDLAGLAADMASFYNLDFDVAFEKIRAGMAGLSKPLRDLGINMNVANLEAFALSQGITKAFKNMTQSEQTMIRYQYLMQATADAQGDFSRTSNELANAQRRVEAAITNIKAALGKTFYDTVAGATDTLASFLEALVPAQKPKTVLDEVNEIEIEKTKKLADIQKIANEANALILALQKVNTQTGVSETSDVIGFVKAFTEQLSGLESATSNAGTLKTNIGLIAEGLSTELGGDPEKWTNLLTAIKNNAKGAIDATKGDSKKTKEFLENVAAGADDLTTDYSGYWDKLLGVLGSNAETAIKALAGGDVAGTALGDIASGANSLGITAGAKWQSFVDALGGIGGSDGANLQSIATALSTNLSGDASKWESLLKAIGSNAKAAIDAIGDNDGSKTKAFLENVAASADDLTTDYSPYWTSLLSALGDNAAKAISALAGGEAAGADLASLASGANDLELLTGTKWKSFVDALGGLAGKSDVSKNLNDVAKALSRNVGGKAADWETLLTAVGDNLGKVTSAVDTDGGSTAEFLQAAADAAESLGGDYSTLWGKLLSTLGTSAGAAVTALKDATNAGDNLGKIADGANELTIGKSAMWGALLTTLTKVDGLQNVFDSTAAGNVEALAKALSNNSPDVTQAEAWQIFLDALGTNPEALTALTQVNADETAAWLETMSEAVNSIDSTDAQAWSTLLGSFVEGLPGLNDTQYGDAFFNAMKNNFLAMGSESDIAAAGLRSLGYSTEDITSLQSQWLIMVQELVKKIPGLSSIINTQTGEIEGGTQALEEYLKEWQNAETKAVYLESWSKARKALDEQYSERYNLQANVWMSQGTLEDLKRQKAELEQVISDTYGPGFLKARNINGGKNKYPEYQAWIDLNNQIYDAEKKAAQAQKDFEEYTLGYNTALEQSDKQLEAINEHFGETAKAEAEAAATTKELTGELSTLAKAANEDETAMKQVETAVNAVDEAMKELADYQEKVRTETESTVRSLISGFSAIETPMQQLRNEEADLHKAYEQAMKDEKMTAEEREAALKKWNDAKQKLTAGEQQTSIYGMTQGLKSQLKYMQEYQNMLAEARAKGVSEDILATLSDGSQESYDYLYAITQYSGNIEELNKAYADVQAEAEKFTTTLTDQKLAADEDFKTLVDKVKEAVGGLDLGETTYDNVSKTLQGIIDACGDKSEAVKKAVDSIYTQMLRLSSVGAGAWFDSGKLTFRNSGVFSYSSGAGSQANGLDYVPYDGYLALLHQGERIQTAAEADLSRRYSYQQPTFDYNAAGAAIGANIGRGNVYLDGRLVGGIIGDRQANSYRALERSGWQG